MRLAVIGDSGTGQTRQYEVAERMVEYHKIFPFEFVLMIQACNPLSVLS